MINIVEICFDRYGEQPVMMFEEVEKLLLYIEELRKNEYYIELHNRNWHTELLVKDFMQIIVFGLTEDDYNILSKNLINP